MDLQAIGIPQVLAQEEQTTQGQAEEHNPILPELDELIFGGLAFLLVFVVLWRYAIPSIGEGLAKRREKIREDLEKAEKTRSEAEQLLARYEERLKEARGEASRIIEEARKTAESVRKDMLTKAEDEARQVVARAQQEIQAERDRTFEELRDQVGELSIEVASRLIGESLDKRRQAKLVDEYIEEIVKSGNGQRAEAERREEGDGGGKVAAKRSSTGSTSRRKSTSGKTAARKASSSKSTAGKRPASRKKS
jgi:F-type H+-transporting ATPase subunit b